MQTQLFLEPLEAALQVYQLRSDDTKSNSSSSSADDHAAPVIQLPPIDARTLLYIIDNCQSSNEAPTYASEDPHLTQLLVSAAEHDQVLAALGARLLSISGHSFAPSVPPFYVSSDQAWTTWYAQEEYYEKLQDEEVKEEDDDDLDFLARETLLAVHRVAWVVELRCKDPQASAQHPSEVMHCENDDDCIIIGGSGARLASQEAVSHDENDVDSRKRLKVTDARSSSSGAVV